MTEFLTPKRIVKAKNCERAENLLVKKSLQIGLCENSTTYFGNGAYIILDYGKELNGTVRILTHLAKNIPVRVRFGESLSECSAELGGAKNATNDHAVRDYTLNLQDYSDMTLINTGFRFLRIDFYGEVALKSVVAINNILRKRPVYGYSGNDKEIRKIFLTAKRTIDLCAAGDYIWDGVKRDRLVWIGDIHPEMLALTTLYGRMENLERSLDFIKEQTPLPRYMNNFPMYSMWWIIIVADYFAATNAEDFAEKQIDYMQGVVKLMLENVSEDGETHYPANFVDWQTHGKEDEIHGVRAINIIAAKKAIELLKHFNKDTADAEELLARLLKIEIAPKTSKSVLGLKYFATGLTADDERKLVAGGAEGMSTFMSYYILKAVASFDREKAIEMFKEYYGAMLKKGATTFWEDFDMKWAENSCRIDKMPKKGERDIHGDFGAYCYIGFRHSLCHGWSSGIIKFIKEIFG